MNEHDLVCLLKQYANECEGSPRKIDFLPWAKERDSRVTSRSIEKFGFINLLNMAGIDHSPKSNKMPKITNEIFIKDIRNTVETYQSTQKRTNEIKSKILIAGDIHFPFEHKESLEIFYQFNREFKPDYIVQVGDLYDMYAHSKFPRSQNIYKPKEEEELAREGAETFFNQLIKDNPKAKIYNLYGNHDIRPVKRTLEQLPTHEHIVEKHLRELMTFNGVTLIDDHRDLLVIEGILFHHGYLGKLGDHRDHALQNFVAGHSHRGGVSYRKIKDQILWELNAGFMGDPDSKVMGYTSSKVQNYTLGFGFIDKFGPRFIHF